jgi:hypothetical protein
MKRANIGAIKVSIKECKLVGPLRSSSLVRSLRCLTFEETRMFTGPDLEDIVPLC